MKPTAPLHIYEVRPRKDHRGVDLISEALPFGGLWYAGPNAASNAVDYAKHYSRSHEAVIRIYDAAGNVIENYAVPVSEIVRKEFFPAGLPTKSQPTLARTVMHARCHLLLFSFRRLQGQMDWTAEEPTFHSFVALPLARASTV